MKHIKTISLIFAVVIIAIVLTAAGCGKKTTEEKITVKDETHWTSSIEKGDIKDQPISGKINGKDVVVKDIQIKKWAEDDYSWSFSNNAPESTCGVITGNDAINFSSKVLQVGTFEKKMEEEIEFNDYHSYYHYSQEDGTPMSINVDWSAKIVITKIDEANKKVSGFAKYDFEDGKTLIEGAFTADLCE